MSARRLVRPPRSRRVIMGGATDPLLAARGRAPSRWRPLGLLGAALAASSIIGYAASRADATGSERLAQAPPTWSLLNPDPSLLEWKLIKPRRELHRVGDARNYDAQNGDESADEHDLHVLS